MNFVEKLIDFCVRRERHRRYEIMREHGLLLTSRTLSWLFKHSEALGCGSGVNTGKVGHVGRFISFMQLTEGISFDMLVESMQYAHDLKKYIFRLAISLQPNNLVLRMLCLNHLFTVGSTISGKTVSTLSMGADYTINYGHVDFLVYAINEPKIMTTYGSGRNFCRVIRLMAETFWDYYSQT